jgi:hypothetical protein
MGPPVQIGSDEALDKSRSDLADLKQARSQMGSGNPAAPILDAQIAALE